MSQSQVRVLEAEPAIGIWGMCFIKGNSSKEKKKACKDEGGRIEKSMELGRDVVSGSLGLA